MSNILFQKQLDISLHQRKTSYGTIKGISTAIGKNLKLTQDSETISVNRKSLKSNKKWFLFHFKNSFCSLYLYFFRGFLSSIVHEVIGTILFFYEEILHAKKILKKHIRNYYSNKKLLIYILCSLYFFMKIYMQTYEEKGT